MLDYNRVNLVYASANATTTLPYVVSQTNCDSQLGGWYYDVDPASGSAPSKIVVCDATCSAFKASGGDIEIHLGC